VENDGVLRRLKVPLHQLYARAPPAGGEGGDKLLAAAYTYHKRYVPLLNDSLRLPLVLRPALHLRPAAPPPAPAPTATRRLGRDAGAIAGRDAGAIAGQARLNASHFVVLESEREFESLRRAKCPPAPHLSEDVTG
jgi:hypothetical protein